MLSSLKKSAFGGGAEDLDFGAVRSVEDPFETLCLSQRVLPAAIEVRGQSISLRLAAPRIEGHNFDSSSCCRSPIHVLARSASSLLAWSALPRAL